MKVKDLKKSTLYQSSDLDDMEVLLCISRNGKPEYDNLCFIALIPMGDKAAVVLGGLTEVQRQVESGKMKKPEGYISPDQTKHLFDDSINTDPNDL